METKDTRVTTEDLKRKLIQRVVLFVFGLVLAAVVTGMLSSLFRTMASPDIIRPPRPGREAIPGPEGITFMTFAPPLVTIVIAGLLIYGLYSIIEIYMRYRKSQQDDREMFP